MALSYLSAWAPQATKQNSNFEVKRNTLCPGVLLGTTMHSILMKRTSTCMLKSLRQKTGRVDVVLAKSSKANVEIGLVIRLCRYSCSVFLDVLASLGVSYLSNTVAINCTITLFCVFPVSPSASSSFWSFFS